MASQHEMLRVVRPAAFALWRGGYSLSKPSVDRVEIDFLQDMANLDGAEPITMRQREKLFELRDDAEYLTQYRD